MPVARADPAPPRHLSAGSPSGPQGAGRIPLALRGFTQMLLPSHSSSSPVADGSLPFFVSSGNSIQPAPRHLQGGSVYHQGVSLGPHSARSADEAGSEPNSKYSKSKIQNSKSRPITDYPGGVWHRGRGVPRQWPWQRGYSFYRNGCAESYPRHSRH